MAQNSRSKRRVTQSLIQSNSEDTPSDSREEEEGEAHEEGRVGFAYSGSPPPPYEAVVGNKLNDVTTPVETPNDNYEGEPRTLNAESKCSFDTSL